MEHTRTAVRSAADEAPLPDTPNYERGLPVLLLVVFTSWLSTTATKLAGSMNIETPYTQNFVRSSAGSLFLLVAIKTGMAARGESIFGRNGRRSTWTFVVFGGAYWFYLWASLESLRLVDVATWQALSECLQPTMTILIALLLGVNEQIGGWQLFILARNCAAILLVVKPPGLFQAGPGLEPQSSWAQLRLGALWVVIQALGSGSMTVLQRRVAKEEHPMVLVFWGALWNVLYWMPPGVFSFCRLPVLWPPVAQDPGNWWEFPVSLWMAMVFSGVCGMACMVLTGVAVRHMTASTYVLLVSPMVLLASVGSGYLLWGVQLDMVTMVGVGIVLAGYGLDALYHSALSSAAPAQVTAQGRDADKL